MVKALDYLKYRVDWLMAYGPITPTVLLYDTRFPNTKDALEPIYNDPRYLPFFYNLGQFINAQNMIEIGFNTGVTSMSFLKSCKSITNFLAFQQKQEIFYTPKFGVNNIRKIYKNYFDFHYGEVSDEAFVNKISTKKWQIVLINFCKNEELCMSYLKAVWDFLDYDGLIIFDGVRLTNDVFDKFVRIKNKDSIIWNTRHGTGLIRK